jgi:GNAT superfamily N-acetyltransferase
MLDVFRPGDFEAVAAFARTQPEFDYLKAIISAHARGRVRGLCRLWREGGQVVAFCAVAFPNQHDAWLYGMRVDDRFKGQGIATRLTRGLFSLARQAGRTWIALDTKDVASKAPVFRICGRLGMKHVVTHATTMLWNLAAGSSRLRPSSLIPHPSSFSPAPPVLMRQRFPLWIWVRPSGPARLFRIAGTRARVEYDFGKGRRWTIVNALERPPDTKAFLSRLLSLATGPRRGVVFVCPAAWQSALRRAASTLAPGLERGKNSSFDAWRIYAKDL